MKFKWNIIVLLFVSFCSSLLSNGWHDKSIPGAFSGSFTSTCYSEGGKNIWAVGYGGLVVCSNDSGVTWEKIPTGITNNLKGVFFLDHLRGWIVGGEDPWGAHCDGIILATTDGGSTWSTQYTSKDIYYSVQFLDPNDGWVVGFDSTYQTYDAGVILHTTDGGKNWERINTEAGWIWCMYFLNSSTGFIGAEPRGVLGGDIWKTSNGGESWTSYTLPFVNDNRRVIDISMSDSLHACCVVPYEGLKYTSDGGITWNSVSSLNFPGLNHIVSAGGETWYATSSSAIYKTIDNCNTWDTVFSDPGVNDITAITFLNPKNGIVLSKSGLALRTNNGGKSWTGNPITVNYLTSPNILSTQIFIVGSNNGRLFKSINGGDTWETMKLPTFANILEVKFTSENLGWVSTAKGLFKTTNGGTSWSNLTTKSLNPIVILSQSNFISGDGYEVYGVHGYSYGVGVISQSVDGGKTWNYKFEQSHDNYPNSISFWNDSCGLASFVTATVKTTDGGKNWFVLPQSQFQNLHSFSLVNDSIAWAFVNNSNISQIIKSTNSGNTWLIVKSTPIQLSGLYFSDWMHGWACGTNGVIYNTTNGGDLWDSTTVGRNIDLSSIIFFDKSFGLSVGFPGKIFKTTNGGVTSANNFYSVPENFILKQNYPNPFNPTTKIKYDIHKAVYVTLKVYDIIGRVIATLVNEEKPAGSYEVEFNGKNLSSGIYFYKLQAGIYTAVKKMILMK